MEFGKQNHPESNQVFQLIVKGVISPIWVNWALLTRFQFAWGNSKFPEPSLVTCLYFFYICTSGWFTQPHFGWGSMLMNSAWCNSLVITTKWLHSKIQRSSISFCALISTVDLAVRSFSDRWIWCSPSGPGRSQPLQLCWCWNHPYQDNSGGMFAETGTQHPSTGEPVSPRWLYVSDIHQVKPSGTLFSCQPYTSIQWCETSFPQDHGAA